MKPLTETTTRKSVTAMAEKKMIHHATKTMTTTTMTNITTKVRAQKFRLTTNKTTNQMTTKLQQEQKARYLADSQPEPTNQKFRHSCQNRQQPIKSLPTARPKKFLAIIQYVKTKPRQVQSDKPSVKLIPKVSPLLQERFRINIQSAGLKIQGLDVRILERIKQVSEGQDLVINQNKVASILPTFL